MTEHEKAIIEARRVGAAAVLIGFGLASGAAFDRAACMFPYPKVTRPREFQVCGRLWRWGEPYGWWTCRGGQWARVQSDDSLLGLAFHDLTALLLEHGPTEPVPDPDDPEARDD